MAKDAPQPPGSFILLDEYYAAGNPAFLQELRRITDPRKLAGFVDKWKNDPRPFARDMIIQYLEGPFATSGHNVVVKRLFKSAEAKKDTLLMAGFLHAFDVLVRRQRRTRHEWDRATRSTYQVEELYAPKNNLTPSNAKGFQAQNPKTLERIFVPQRRVPKNGRLFSYRTRYYLRRRAWRYFRFLGYKNPAAFVTGTAAGLVHYTDEDLAKGEHILDSWSLLNACYRHSSLLEFTPSQVKLQPNSSLNELTPAPKHLKAWKSADGAAALWTLVTGGKARMVRMWAMSMLKTHHQEFLANLTADHLLPLFDSFDEETQQFAAQAMEAIPSLPSLPIATWLRLLTVKNPGALAMICDLMLKHVSAERFNLQQAIMLAISNPAPVAALGLAFLKTKAISTAAEREAISDLARAQSQAVAPRIAAYALWILGPRENYDLNLVSRFFDALVPAIRAAAWEWLASDAGAAGYGDPALWVRLMETPYEDVRLRLVKALEARAGAAATVSVDQLTPIWTAVLLGIHRGGRHKIIALHQISRAVVVRPESAAALVPVLAIALRSVRPAEARVGLAAIVESAQRNPVLLETISAAIPELRFVSAGATV